MDRFTDVTSESWFGRMFDSIKTVGFGLLLIIVSGVMLFWNEGRAVTTARSLAEGGGAVVNAAADKVEPGNENKLVHISGEATSKAAATDPDYGVSAPNPSLLIERRVEMYQWKQSEKTEKRTKIGGGTETTTTYTYSKDWSSTLNQTSSFKHPENHQNPQTMPESKSFVADPVTLGGFKLPPPLIKKIDQYKPVTPSAEPVAASPQGKTMRVVGDQLYRGADPAQPAVGDIRISFRYVAPTVVSVIAQQTGDTFQPYQTKSGDALEMLTMGTVSADQMFKQAADSNASLTWVLRGVGWLLMTIGIGCLFSPFTTFASVLPFMGDILGFGIFIFALVVGFAVSLVIVSIAWIAYRPLLGIGMLVAAIAVFMLVKRAGAARRP